MQHINGTEKIGLIKEVAHTDVILTDSLAKVVDKFDLERNLSIFNTLKDRGYAISSLVKVCVIMPFLKSATIYALLKHGVSGSISAKKDAYYTAKNNEHIDWRSLLYKISKRFMYLVSNDIPTGEKRVTAIIFDDTLLEKTGKCIEKVSLTFDHVSKRYQLGFKLLVCAFWDGVSFIPLDFTLHREKVAKQEEITNQYHRTTKALESTEGLLKKAQKQLEVYQKKQTIAQLMAHTNSNILNNKLLNNTNLKYQRVEEEIQAIEKQLVIDTKAQAEAKLKMDQMYSHGTMYGLTKSERKAQYKKDLSVHSDGYTRRKEVDRSKGEQLLAMLKRAVKNNFIPQYVLTDSWFFSESLILGVKSIRNGCINLISMVKINNQVFEEGKDNREIGVKQLLKSCLTKKSSTCKKYHASYYKRSCTYKGIPVNLFFIKMGRSSNWHLLATTDLELNFIELMKTYQIRWSIEVFFHEAKGYLYLGKCQSSNFDAQIADTTITMIQYVMLSYCKRINYETSLGDLFKSLSAERMKYNLL